MAENKDMRLNDDELDVIVGGNGPSDREIATYKICPACNKKLLMTERQYEAHVASCKAR